MSPHSLSRPDWPAIDTVLLDLDGTLLDQAYDNHIWRDLVPQRFALAQSLDLQAAYAEIARRFAEATFFADNREDLPRVSVPTLILQCSDDLIAPDEVGEYLHREIPGSTLRRLQATGHCPHMSHPEETIEAIREYLSGVPA